MISLTCGVLKNGLINITKERRIHRYKEQPRGYQWEEGRGEGQERAGDSKVQTVTCKISHKDTHTTQGIQSTANVLHGPRASVHLPLSWAAR